MQVSIFFCFEFASPIFTINKFLNFRIAASYGLASAFVYQKQVQRAKTILKRVVLKATWQFEEADYLERSWLLMAELYYQSGKTGVCIELVNKVLAYNKSSITGLELLSIVAEKEQKYGNVSSTFY